MENKRALQRESSNDEIEIDLLVLIKAIWKKAWIVVLASILCGLLVLGGSIFFITPQYQSSTLFYVNNNSLKVGSTSVSISSDELSAAQSLVDTYIVILKTRKTLMDVIDYGDLDLTYEQLGSMISAEAVNSTEVFEIVVTGPDPDQNLKICNAIAHVMPDKIADVVDGSSVRIVDYAVVASEQCSPSYKKNTAIGVLLGMLISMGIIVVIELMDQKIHNTEHLKQNFRIPVLASIPDMESTNVICNQMSFSGEEAYKQLRTKLMFSFSDDIGCHVVGITSSVPGEGKSVTSINLAYSLAQLGKKVLLIDGDMRLPVVQMMLHLKEGKGLSNYLVNDRNLKQLIQSVLIEDADGDVISTFHVITAGEEPPNPAELLSSLRLEILLDELRMEYDYILFDFPPVLEVADALTAANVLDGTIMVVRENYCNQKSLKQAVEQVEFVDSKLLGFVYNMSHENNGDYGVNYKKYNRYYHGYANKKTKKAKINEKKNHNK